MRYFVTVAGRTLEVVLENGAIRIDGQAVDAELVDVPGTPLRHLRIDGESWPLVARKAAERGDWDVHIGGGRFAVTVVDERTKAIREMTGRADGPRGPRPLRAPMPGLVARVEVTAGQIVRRGDGIVIVEAMKMENELKADTGGVVSRIHVTPGQAVEKGALLVEFEAGA
jgi:pyruvate carboxylase subunit B